MRPLRYVICDVFTNRALAGNPLAVYTDGRGLDGETMQRIAREMNLSETVFVLPPTAGGSAKVRIFTPRCELPFAGHPVLGTAFVLGGPLQSELVRLETGAGIIPVTLERAGAKIVFGWMDQNVPSVRPFAAAAELFAALGVSGSALPVLEYDNGAQHTFVILDSPDAVAAVCPDFARIADLTSFGVSVSAGAGVEWKTRMFAPARSVPEDPATGSAAGPLGVHLCRHGLAPFGEVLRVSQGAELLRPSTLSVCISGNADQVEAVRVGGEAIIVARGELHL